MQLKYVLIGIIAIIAYKIFDAISKKLKGSKLSPSRTVTVRLIHEDQKLDAPETISMLWDEKYIAAGHKFSYKGSMYTVESITEREGGVYILANYVK